MAQYHQNQSSLKTAAFFMLLQSGHGFGVANLCAS